MVDTYYKVLSGQLKKLADMGDGTSSEVVVAHPPFDLLTDGGDGPNRRMRVDVGQTGFFAGREFRAFNEINASKTIKAVVPINLILWDFNVTLLSGGVRIETVVGGTEVGDFNSSIPSFPRNTMTERPSPVYTSQVTLSTGGSLDGGSIIDILSSKTADNSNFSLSIGSSGGDERGIGPGTYYFRITVSGTVEAIFKARWEERP